MVGHICRFNPRYAAAKREIELGSIGRIVSIYARRNIPAAVGAQVLHKIGPIIGDGVHDTDLMLWYTGASIETAYAQSLNVRGLKHPDLGWTMYRFDSGAIGVCENIWFLPDKTAFQIDERMEIIGTEGSIHIQETHPNFSVVSKDGWRSPDTTYWPELHGLRAGALRTELDYFLTCVLENKRPAVISPEESLRAVEACLAAEESRSHRVKWFGWAPRQERSQERNGSPMGGYRSEGTGSSLGSRSTSCWMKKLPWKPPCGPPSAASVSASRPIGTELKWTS